MDTPAGWYPDPSGQPGERYWDGEQWNDHFREVGPASTPAQRPAEPTQPGTKRGWLLPTIVGVVALLVGLGIGAAAAGTADPKDSEEYRSMRGQKALAESELATAEANLEEAEATIGDLPDREAALEDAQSELDARGVELTRQAARLKKAEAAVAKREKKVGLVEKAIAANTIYGDGVWEVGTDIAAGTYKTKGGAQCYWAVNADPNGNDIVANGNISGPGILTANNGQYVELSGCNDWVLQR